MTLSPRERQELFLELAGAQSGTTAQDAHAEGVNRGDTVSQEAYFNLGRRLAHQGIVRTEKPGARTIYFASVDDNATWLDEAYIASIVDPEYPLSALTAYRESLRQIREIPEHIWIEARERLARADARTLMHDAICSYADNLLCEVKEFARERALAPTAPHLSNLRRSAERSMALLVSLAKDGLGLSEEAITIPPALDIAAERVQGETAPESYYNSDRLRDELSRRVEPGSMIRSVPELTVDHNMVIAGVDGSSVGGLLALDGVGGDFSFGHSPQVSVNTAAGQLNRDIRANGRQIPAFLRLPEKPEDMQQRDNRYSIMAKMFYPDLTDSEYVHSAWNAMDLLECRATHGVMSRWTTLPTNVELPAADVVFRDGTIVPNDRDPIHYGQQNAYGRIVRELIAASWRIAKNCDEDAQTVVGVVKNAQLRVFGPVINFFLCHVAADEDHTQLHAWPLEEMNQLFDQALLSRILTSGREQGDAWLRTALIIRPFHATSNLGKTYSREPGKRPAEKLIRKSEQALEKNPQDVTEDDAWWRTLRPQGDPYIQMLRNVSYAGFYLGAFPRLDRSLTLTRFEILLPNPTDESGEFPQSKCDEHLDRTLTALRTVNFDVDNEHAMFDEADRIDLLPTILIQAHDTVKNWAKQLRDRVAEYMDWHLSKYLTAGQARRLRLRPWTRAELKAWVDSMQEERRRIGG